MYHNTYPTEPCGGRGLYIDEPLQTTAPADARPHCCYVSTVIFYDQAAWQRGAVVELDRVECEWNLLGQRWTDEDLEWAALAPFMLCDGELYELASATVLWRDGWIKRWLAWRVPADDRRLAHMTDLTQLRSGVRVVCPGGIAGTVERISGRPNARWPVLVRRDDGTTRSYAATELTRLAAQSQARGMLP